MKKNPLVSIVITTKNYGIFLNKSFESVILLSCKLNILRKLLMIYLISSFIFIYIYLETIVYIIRVW